MNARTRSPWEVASAALVPVVLLALLLPLLSGLAMSLSAAEGRAALASWWLRPRGWDLLWRSFLFAASGATVGLIAGWMLALALRPGALLSRLALLGGCLPMLVPSSLMGVGWIMAMGRDAVVTNTLRSLFDEGVPTIYAWPLAAAATGLRYFGVAALVIATAGRHGPSSRAAERVFHLPWWSRVRLRVGATVAPALLAWLLLVLLVQSDHILPGMFLVHTFGTDVLIQFTALLDPAGAAGLALVPALIALMVMLAVAEIVRRGGGWAGGGVAHDDAALPRRYAWLNHVVVVAVLFVAVGVPLTGLVVRAGTCSNLRDAWREAGLEVGQSVRLAAWGAAITVLLATPLAHGWVASQARRRASAATLVLLNLAVPGSLLALGILALPAPRVLVNSDAPLLFGYAVRFAAVAVIVLFAGWVRLTPTGDAAARVHGVPPVRRFAHLTFPARAPAALAALALVALLVIAELEISLILVRPGPTTLGVRLYTMIHTAPDHLVAALAVDVLLLAIAIALAVAAGLHLHTRARRSRVA